MRRFLTTELPSEHSSSLLNSEVSHHMLRVVGIAPNEEVELFDGQGRGCVAKLTAVEQGRAQMSWVSTLSSLSSRPELWLFLTLTKGDAFSNALRMSTELGVTHIVPMTTERSIVKGDKNPRWVKIVEAASMQSKRLSTPLIHPLQTFKQGLAWIPQIPNHWVLQPHSQEVLKGISGPTALWIGPEGGFSPKELQLLTDAGVESRSLGQLVLKADTAAVVATALALSGQ